MIEIYEKGKQQFNKPFLIVDNTNRIEKKSEDQKGETDLKIKGITIHKNKTCNTWYTRYRKDGKQYYISAKTQKECYKLLKEQLNIVSKDKKKEIYTLNKWYFKWLELFKTGKVKESTIITYKNSLRYVPNTILNKYIKDIKKIELQEIIEKVPYERQKQRVFDFLKDIFTKAFNYELIKENPFNILEKPKHTKKKGTALNEEEQKIFIERCKTKEEYFIFLIILYQGLRRGETLALTKTDIDLIENKININKSLNDNNKIDTTKNKYSNRKIPIFQETINILKKLTENIKDNERIFKYSRTKIHNLFKEVLLSTNLPQTIRIHDLRHTFITNCKNQNIPEHIIQTWVGHSIGSVITSSVYTHKINEENEIKIINKFYSDSTQKKED